ncbi:hypothetical protein D3C81_2025370 [compost metagenome]
MNHRLLPHRHAHALKVRAAPAQKVGTGRAVLDHQSQVQQREGRLRHDRQHHRHQLGDLGAQAQDRLGELLQLPLTLKRL